MVPIDVYIKKQISTHKKLLQNIKNNMKILTSIPLSFVTSISSAVEPNLFRPGFGDSEPPEDFAPGETLFSKPFL
jgi:hypothetical protein